MKESDRPIWQLTVLEFTELIEQTVKKVVAQSDKEQPQAKKYVYGIAGIAELFGCSKVTANSIKQSGRIDKAITQIGRKIVVDAELALSLIAKKK
jgi:hypothetical protein